MQLVAVAGGQVESVDLLELLDDLDGGVVEGGLVLEGVQHDALQQVTEGQVEVLGEALEDLQQPALHADAGLDTLYCYHGNMVHQARPADQLGRRTPEATRGKEVAMAQNQNPPALPPGPDPALHAC